MSDSKRDKPGEKNSLHRQLADIGEQLRRFWEETYPGMTLEDKRNYWISQLKPGIEWEKGQNGNALALFGPESLSEWREKEPGFLEILSDIGPQIGLTAQEMIQIIQNNVPPFGGSVEKS